MLADVEPVQIMEQPEEAVEAKQEDPQVQIVEQFQGNLIDYLSVHMMRQMLAVKQE